MDGPIEENLLNCLDEGWGPLSPLNSLKKPFFLLDFLSLWPDSFIPDWPFLCGGLGLDNGLTVPPLTTSPINQPHCHH